MLSCPALWAQSFYMCYAMQLLQNHAVIIAPWRGCHPHMRRVSEPSLQRVCNAQEARRASGRCYA